MYKIYEIPECPTVRVRSLNAQLASASLIDLPAICDPKSFIEEDGTHLVRFHRSQAAWTRHVVFHEPSQWCIRRAMRDPAESDSDSEPADALEWSEYEDSGSDSESTDDSDLSMSEDAHSVNSERPGGSCGRSEVDTEEAGKDGDEEGYRDDSDESISEHEADDLLQ
ncbi:hypothetical protein TRAPUB_9247 [Trametes pubescens]|uniref:Uncharacterized protein n=1 Tax=Trametes pubescens TaxID=154538 RepID=A0A1M2W2V5_TRAPU|nr:hypothetical protein TRAPUB_9247 [Trametes pubescens]